MQHACADAYLHICYAYMPELACSLLTQTHVYSEGLCGNVWVHVYIELLAGILSCQLYSHNFIDRDN